MNTPAPAGVVGRSHARWRWVVCGLLLGATFLNYLDRQTLSVSAPLIRAELGLDLSQLGLIFSAFYWSYAAGQILVGFVLDRVPVKYAYPAAVAAWSAVGALAGLATGMWSLLLLRVALGVCEAANWPAAMSVVARQFPPAERSLANGIFQSGTSLGAVVAPPLLITVAAHHGWRSGFVLVGMLGFVWVFAWRWLYRDVRAEPIGALEAAGAAPAAARVPLSALLRSRRLLGLVLASSFLNPCLYFYVNWLPTYFEKAGVAFGQRMALMLLVTYLALDFGYVTGGALVVKLSRHMGVLRARRTMVTLGAPLPCALLMLPLLESFVLVTAMIALATLGVGWFMVNYLAFVEELAHDRVATTAGLLGAAGSLSGAAVMWLVGAMTQATGSFDAAFGLMAAMPIVAAIGIYISTTGPSEAYAS